MLKYIYLYKFLKKNCIFEPLRNWVDDLKSIPLLSQREVLP